MCHTLVLHLFFRKPGILIPPMGILFPIPNSFCDSSNCFFIFSTSPVFIISTSVRTCSISSWNLHIIYRFTLPVPLKVFFFSWGSNAAKNQHFLFLTLAFKFSSVTWNSVSFSFSSFSIFSFSSSFIISLSSIELSFISDMFDYLLISFWIFWKRFRKMINEKVKRTTDGGNNKPLPTRLTLVSETSLNY